MRLSKLRPNIQVGVFALLLLSRLIFLLASIHGQANGDGPGYLAVANSVVDTGLLPPLRVQAHGFGVLLAPFVLLAGEHVVWLVQALQIGFDLAVVILLGRFTWMLMSESPAQVRFLTCCLVLIQPFTATMTPAIYTEPLLALLFCVATFLLARGPGRSGWLVACLVLGVASTTRIELVPLSVLIVCAAWWISNRGKRIPLLALSLALTMLPLVALAGYQAGSTGNVGIVKKDFRQEGYYSWMRTWFAPSGSYERFAFAVWKSNWPGYQPSNYPTWAFADGSELGRVSVLLADWKVRGYRKEIDSGFQALAEERISESPVRTLVLVPLVRAIHFWANLDGAQVFLRVIELKPPLSTVVVAGVVALRGAILVAFALGAFALLFRRDRYAYFYLTLGTIALVAVLARTLQLAVLGTVAWGGLMEVRYVTMVWPEFLVVAVFGVHWGTARSGKSARTISVQSSHE
jgi:hypothetical protein